MTRNVNVNWFQVELPDDSQVTFQNILEQQNRNWDPNNKPVVPVGDFFIVLGDFSQQDDITTGQLVLVNMNQQPAIVNVQQPSRDTRLIQMAAEEGIGNETAFLYAPQYRILMFHSRFGGVSRGRFSYFWEDIGEVSPIELKPVLDLTTHEKFNKMRMIRKLEVQVADLRNQAIIEGDDCTVSSILSFQQDYEAPKLKLELSIGRSKKGTIHLENTKRLIRQLSGRDTTEKLVIKGKENEDSDPEVLDLIKQRIVSRIEVEVRNRRLDMKNLLHNMISEYNRKLLTIQGMFED